MRTLLLFLMAAVLSAQPQVTTIGVKATGTVFSPGVVASTVGCGTGGAYPSLVHLDDTACGNVTTDGSVLSYESPAFSGSPTSVSTTCGQTLTLATDYQLSGNITCGSAASTALTIRYAGGQTCCARINLNGFTVTGRILADDGSGPKPDGFEVFGGTVNCTVSVAGGASAADCLDITYTNGSAPPSKSVVFHHLTIVNSADNGSNSGISAELSSAMAGGAYSCVLHHITQVISGGTTAGTRTGGIGCTGTHQTAHLYNNLASNSAGTNHDSTEELGCYNADTCDIHNNSLSANLMTLSSATPGRMVLIDGDAFGNCPCTSATRPGFTQNANVYNNYFSLQNTRGVRLRSGKVALIHDNIFANVTDANNLVPTNGVIMFGEPTGVEPTLGNIYYYDYTGTIISNNQFTLIASQGGSSPVGPKVFWTSNNIGVEIKNNTVTCSGCSTQTTTTGSFIDAHINTSVGTTSNRQMNVQACNNTLAAQLISPQLNIDGSGSGGGSMTNVITHNGSSGTCTASGGTPTAAACTNSGTCP